MEIKNSKFDLYEYGGGYYRVIVYDVVLARRVNRLLKQYENYTFKTGDEPVFKFTDNQMPNVLVALKYSN